MNEIEKLKRVKELEVESWKDSKSMERKWLEIVAILEDVLKQNPQNVISLTNLGAIFSNLGRYEESLELLKKAEQLNFKDKNLYYNLAVVSILVDFTAPSLERERKINQYFETSKTMESNDLTFEAYIDYQAM